jgi:PPP family 3-phenylpropionic acid transporter
MQETKSGLAKHHIFSTFFFFYFGYLGIVSPYMSLYFNDIGFTAIQISVLMSMLQVTRIIGPFAWGWFADYRQDRIGLMRVTVVLCVIIFLGIFVSNQFYFLLAWMFVLNTFSSSLTPLSEAVTIRALQKVNAFESKYGRIRLWGSIGFILAVSGGGFWFEKFGIATLPYVALFIMCGVLVSTWMLWEPPHEPHEKQKGEILTILKKPEVIWFFSSTFCMIFAHASYYVFYSLYLSKLGYGTQTIGIFWMLGVLAEVLFFYYQRFFLEKFGAQQILVACFLVAAMRFATIAYLPIFALLLFMQIFHAMTFGAHHTSSLRFLQQWFNGPTQARGQALYTSISYGLGGTIGGFAAGWVWDVLGAEHVFGLSAIASLLGYFAIKQSIKITHSHGHPAF